MDSTIHRGLIILATGAWTTSIFPEMKDMIKPIGQPVIHLQVPPSLQDMFATENCPVWAADLANLGFYGFPLVKGENIVKIAHHGNGYTYQQNNNYMPKTVISDPTTGSRIPLKAVHAFRTFLNGHFPHLAQLDITHTRMCWYTDSWDGHFYITRVPGHPNLIVATGGSGHGFKFMPVIGDIVVDVINGVDTEATRRFQWRQPMGETKEECRGHFGNPDCLNTVILATDADLKSNALCHL
ncbi:FAD dependent oxidoreductase-domain-containing protein [Globomyces pollinis-pini]|nr:FAD dependent oxidoreductase-domain-containing protein [Globomyces pollinis-pini]